MSVEFVLGITGHRPNRLQLSLPELRQCLHNLFGEIRQVLAVRCPGCSLVALSALAEGADQVFAEAALGAECNLRVVLPLPQDPYLATFSEAADKESFKQLLGCAVSVHVLGGCADDLPGAFARLGSEIVGQSHLVVGVWDGQHAAGPGGTAAVMQQAIDTHGVVGCVDATGQQSRVRWLSAMWPPAEAAASPGDALTLIESRGDDMAEQQHGPVSCSNRPGITKDGTAP